MKAKLVGLILLSMVVLACGTKKKHTQENLPELRIEFGFVNQRTGGANTYILADNGMLYQKSTISKGYNEFKKLGEKDAALIFSTVDQLKQSHSSIYKIGEVTHFVRLRTGVELQEWKWDANDSDLPVDLKKLDELFAVIFEK
jgi:hypothetical protein